MNNEKLVDTMFEEGCEEPEIGVEVDSHAEQQCALSLCYLEQTFRELEVKSSPWRPNMFL